MTTKTTEQKLFERYRDLDERDDFPVADITHKVALISTPRCGSTMFCTTLHNTNRMGNPMEWINMRYIKAYCQYFKVNRLDFNAYFDFIKRKTTSPNGVFSLNFHVSQYTKLLEQKIDILKFGFDKIYYLKRNDKIAQAYSLLKANVTDQWSSTTKAKQDFDDSKLTKSQILQHLMHIVQSDEYYETYLKHRTDREFAYEDFRNMEQTEAYKQVFEDIGIPFEDIELQAATRKQSGPDVPDKVAELRRYLGAE